MKVTDDRIITLIETQQYLAKYATSQTVRIEAEETISALSELLRLRTLVEAGK
jgi:hypothetical protein